MGIYATSNYFGSKINITLIEISIEVTQFVLKPGFKNFIGCIAMVI